MEESEKLTLAEVAKLKQELEKVKEELNTTNNNLRRLKKQNALITWVFIYFVFFVDDYEGIFNKN